LAAAPGPAAGAAPIARGERPVNFYNFGSHAAKGASQCRIAAAEAGLDEEPRHLRRLAAARLADEEHRRVRLDRREDLVARGEHGQRRVHGDAPRRARREVREDLLRLLLFGLR